MMGICILKDAPYRLGRFQPLSCDRSREAGQKYEYGNGGSSIFVSGFSGGHLRRRGSFPAVQAGSRYQKLHLKRHFRSVLINPTCKVSIKLPCSVLLLCFAMYGPFRFTTYSMASQNLPVLALRALSKSRPSAAIRDGPILATSNRRAFHICTRIPAITASNSRSRPRIQPLHHPATLAPSSFTRWTRTIFIQTETTPNADVRGSSSGR